jgi:hypothetical protein
MLDNPTQPSFGDRPRLATPLAGLLAGAAGLLVFLSVTVNVARGCVVEDTPYLFLCAAEADEPRARIAAAQSRIAASPGDSAAYLQLALATTPAERPPFLDAAARLAPHDPTVLAMQASAAAERQDWPRAVAALVELAEYREQPEAAQTLARLIAAGQGELLLQHLGPGSRWLQAVLRHLAELGGSFAAGVPLIAEASRRGILKPGELPGYIRELKAAGAWVDANSLWLTLHPQGAPVLYNASFDQPLVKDGFDWELSQALVGGQTGAVVQRSAMAGRGRVLEVRLTGRALPSPLLRQYVFLGEGRYRLKGEYLADHLRMDHGLVWSVRCTASAAQPGRSAPLADSSGRWQAFAFDVSVPPGCGMVASLQLETSAPYEAVAGGRGELAFDGLALDRLP